MVKRSIKVTNFCLGVLISCLTLVSAQAADVLAPNWNLNDINSQLRSLTADYSGISAVIGGASKTGSATNNTLSIDGLTVSAEDDVQAAFDNGTDVLIGGAVYQNVASRNRLEVINGSTIQGRTVIGGAALLDSPDNRLGYGTANGNVVSISDSFITESSTTVTPSGTTRGGDVIGGFARYANGTANGNTVILNNTSVDKSVYGAYVDTLLVPDVDYDTETGDLKVALNYSANNNTVRILNGSTVNSTVVGSYGADNISGNLVELDASTATTVLGASNGMAYYSGSSSSAISTFSNNTVKIVNGSTVSNAHAITGYSSNAIGNNLIIDNSTVSNGYVRAAYITLSTVGENETPVNATVDSNRLYLSNLSGVNFREIGAGLNHAGTANNHTVSLANLTGVTVNRPFLTFGMLDFSDLASQKLISLKDLTGAVTSADNFNGSYGFIYGGAGLNYTSQINFMPDPVGGVLPDGAGTVPNVMQLANGGTNADGNVVYIADSSINANVTGGFVAQVQEVNYTNWAKGGTDTAPEYIKTVTKKVGNELDVTSYTCDQDGGNCVVKESNSSKVTDFNDEQYSASNNTVVLDNTTFDGTLYGGFVAGADLNVGNVSTSNNTVILRGNTAISAASMLYGGNAYLGSTTNYLVFDHVAGAGGSYATFNNANQFKNFNKTWLVNADLDTRINFNFYGVDAEVMVDRNDIREGSATIIKTKTTYDLTDVEQNGVLTDLTDNSIELAQKRVGIYSYSLTPTKEDASTVGWVLGIERDQNNVEVYGQLPLVGLAVATEGAEMMSNTLSEAFASDAERNAFVSGGYSHTRYHTGSGFDLNSGLVQAGFWKKFTNDLLGGFFVKYSGGSYKTYPIEAKGNAKAYGGGLMGSLRYSEMGRVEASVEVGYLNLRFDSSELLSTMKSKGTYYGASFGVIQGLIPNWDVFANLRYLRKDKDDMTDSLGQSVSYEAMQSITLQAGTEVAFPNVNWGGLVPSVGVSGIYEFDGKSKVDVMNMSNNEASLKGLSGRGEVGLTYQNDEAMLPVTSKLTVFGQAGKRTGFGGEINVSFQF